MTDWIDFAEIRNRVSLERVILEYYKIDTLKRRGNKLIGPCPIHQGDSPRAFHADLSKNVWHCFTGCKSGGNQLDFVVMMEKTGLREAAIKLRDFFLSDSTLAGETEPATMTGTVKPSSSKAKDKATTKKRPDEAEDNPPLSVKLQLLPDHPHLMKVRGFKAETIEHFGLGYCSRGIMRGCIAIPIHDEHGALIAYAGRRLKAKDIKEEGKYKFPKGFRKDLVLYNFNQAKEVMKEQGLILVEGFFTVAKLWETGFQNTVACMGSSLSDAQAELLLLSREVVILFDGDEAGIKGAEAARDKLKDKVRTRLIRLPEGTTPDALSPKALRWLLIGITALDFAEIALTKHPQIGSDGEGGADV